MSLAKDLSDNLDKALAKYNHYALLELPTLETLEEFFQDSDDYDPDDFVNWYEKN